MAAALRVWLLGLLAVAAWLLALYGTPRPTVLGVGAPAAQFSAARAEEILARLLGTQKPHPAGTSENTAVYARVMAELAQLGINAETISGMSCRRFARGDAIACGTVSDIVAEAIPGNGKALLLMAHLDSVAAGPGAADDEAGVAAILETIRALKAEGASASSSEAVGHQTSHPVDVLISDGEEMGLLGADLFLRDPDWPGRIGAVINAEARGNQGPSYLFQTSAGNGALVDLYAAATEHPATSSLYGEIYKYLPNDTDLTPFLRAGYPAANFAFIGDIGAYHTPLDVRKNLDPASLQAQGDNVLGLARGLRGADFAALKSQDAMDFDVLSLFLPRLPQSFALPLALLSFFGIALAGWLNRRNRPPQRGKLAAFLMPPLFLLGAVAAGFALSALVGLISGDAVFAYPMAFRIALAFAVWTVALLAMRSAGGTASWLWLAGLGIASAVLAPGLSPYFIFPALIAAVLLLLTAGFGRPVALLMAALVMLVVWIGLAFNAEAIMGIAAHPLFTVPAAIGLIALLPLMGAQKMGEGARNTSIVFSLLVALGATLFAGLEPAFSAAQPQRLNLRYVEKDGKSWWLADPVAQLPASMRSVAAFSKTPLVLAAWRGYIAPAGIVQLPAPSATVSRNGNSVTLDLHGSAETNGMALIVSGGLAAVTVGGVRVAISDAEGPGAGGRVSIGCGTPDCAGAHVVLDFAGPVPKSVLLAEQRYGLPADAAFLLRARPDWAVPSGSGDMSYAAEDIAIPQSGP